MKYWQRAWRVVRWLILAVVLLYIGLVLYRIPAVREQEKTAEVVAQIHAQKITLADVMGKALPPAPDPQENNATVAGIDKNDNGIRDDVELAIFKEYPNSAKIRAAELQYAMTEQLFLTKVFNTETWKAVAEADSRASFCVSLTYPRTNLKTFGQVIDSRIKEVESLVFNTQQRRMSKDSAFEFTTSYGLNSTNACDVNLANLPN